MELVLRKRIARNIPIWPKIGLWTNISLTQSIAKKIYWATVIFLSPEKTMCRHLTTLRPIVEISNLKTIIGSIMVRSRRLELPRVLPHSDLNAA